MSTPDARLVVMTKEQRDALRGGPSAWLPVQEITAAYDAAPANPLLAVAAVLGSAGHRDWAERWALAMLAALGCSPHPRNEDHEHEWKPVVFGGTDGWRCKCGAIQ